MPSSLPSGVHSPMLAPNFPQLDPLHVPKKPPPQPPILPSHPSLHPRPPFHSRGQPCSPLFIPLTLFPQTPFPPHRSSTQLSSFPLPPLPPSPASLAHFSPSHPPLNPPYPPLESCRRICRRSPREVWVHPGGSGLNQKSLEMSQVGFGCPGRPQVDPVGPWKDL